MTCACGCGVEVANGTRYKLGHNFKVLKKTAAHKAKLSLAAKKLHADNPATHCHRGHEFTPENAWIGKRGSRQCRICQGINYRKRPDNGIRLPEFTARFWAQVDKSGNCCDCWEWRGGYSSNGYGKVRMGKKSTGAHRAAYLIGVGEIPVGLLVCHKCDNPKCVRPEHLFLGTPKDNTQDMLAKGRHRKAKSA